MRERLGRLLRWSEKYTKTDMVYLASGGFWLTAEQILIGLAAFAVSVAFARFVPKEIYGTYRFLLSLFWTLTAFSLTGAATALNRAVARGEEGAYRSAFALTLLGGLLISVIAGGLSFYYFHAGNATLGYGTLIIALVAPFFEAGYLYGNFLEGKRDFRRTAIFGIILNVVPSILLLVSMAFVTSAAGFFLVYLGGSAATALVLTYFVFRIHKPNRVKSTELATYSWHLSAINILGTIATQLDELLVFHYLGSVDLAIYSFATALPDQAKSMVTNLGNIAFPKFVGRPIEEIRQTMGYRILVLTGIVALGAGIYILLAPWFFAVFFPAYGVAVPYSRLYALTIVAAGSFVPVTALQAHAAKRELYIFNIVSSIVQIGALFAGVIYFGLVGIIGGWAISRVFNFFLGLILVDSYAARAS